MPTREPSQRSQKALSCLTFCLADVLTGVGPFMAVYLKNSRGWRAQDIGVLISCMSLAGVLAQTPAGALIDRLRAKRSLVAIVAAIVGLGSLATLGVVRFWPMLALQSGIGMLGALFPPAVAAISLGLVGHRALDRRISRNETFNHAGNVVTALAAGLLAYCFSDRWIFYVVAVMSLFSVASVAAIRGDEIDFERARGGTGKGGASAKPESIRALLKDRRLRVFALSVVLFHFANAAMLPLVGQYLSDGHARESALLMAVCIVGAQAVMVPVAAMAGRLVEKIGHKGVFLMGLGALPVRGVLYTFSGKAGWLVAVQLLDGIGAGVFGVVSVLVIADLTAGTGRFNATLGMVATATGLGAALSAVVAESVVQRAGYNAAFLLLAAIGILAWFIYWMWMPETSIRFPQSQPIAKPTVA